MLSFSFQTSWDTFIINKTERPNLKYPQSCSANYFCRLGFFLICFEVREMKQMSLNCLAHAKAIPFFLNSKLCQFALIFCLCVKQDEPDSCPSGIVSLCARILFKCVLAAQMQNPRQHLKQASALLCKISVALEHSCQHLLKTKFMTNSSFATRRVKRPLVLGTG